MELKNNFSLSKDEASDLLYNVANSLKNRGKFEISLPNQEISLNIGEEFNATLIVSDTRFSLDFNWIGSEVKEEEESVDWRQQFDKDMAEAGLPISESESIPVPAAATSKPSQVPSSPQSSVTAAITELQGQGLGPRRVAERMILETTTLPYEGGVWNPAFNLSHALHWTEIGIDNKLENTKWISEEELEAMEAAPRSPRKAISEEVEADLFEDLDDDSIPINSVKRPQGGIRRRTTRQVVTPAAMIHHVSTIGSDIDEKSISEAAAEWSEPEKEKTDDEWVKPSEFIQKKAEATTEEPKLDQPGKTEPKRDLTPPPVTIHKTVKLEDEILDWKEPGATESKEEMVKPSEILKQKNRKRQTKSPSTIPKTPPTPKTPSTQKKSRPPPVAPDKPPSPKKKKKDEEDENKGWATWDK
ncbi:MAG: hypothetical protein ACW99Q_09235 [Candidatus Kariarchaeaceae archaeon]|jgi:hypothetical protein